MENIENIIKFAEWLALPVTYLVLIILFFAFVVRPFFTYLFSHERLKAQKILQESEEEEIDDNDIPDVHEDDGIYVDLGKKADKNLDQETLNKLAEGNPEKAGDLVKHWLKKDEQ